MRQNIDREKTVTGYVATAPETVNTQRGQMVAFRLAEPQEIFDRETRQYRDLDPIYYDVRIGREQLGKNVLESVDTGQRVSVMGKYSVEPYVNREGQAGLNNGIWADEVSASMQHNTVQMGPSVGGAQAGRERGLEGQRPENVAADPAWQASTQPVEQNLGVEQAGPGMSGPSR